MVIVLSIFNFIGNDQANNERHLTVQQLMKTYGSGYFLANVLPNIGMIELIRWYYNTPIKTRAYLDGIFAELKQRINSLDANNLEANKEALFEIRAQSQNGSKIPKNWAHKISDAVRINVQRQVDDECSGGGICDLSPIEPTSGMISNKLLEALAYFDKSIFVPPIVRTLILSGLDLTSLWLKFKEDSRIQTLSLRGNKFTEFNDRTFGQYIHPTARQGLKYLNVGGSSEIVAIDFDELRLPNIIGMYARDCSSLSAITNVPRSIERIFFNHTNVTAMQFQFKHQTGNNLNNVVLDTEAVNGFDQLLKSVYPKWQRNDYQQGRTRVKREE